MPDAIGQTITPAYVSMMAAYNAEMNCRLFAAAARLPEQAVRAHRGAFWASIHGTLAHLLWGDRQWMSRFAGWEKNLVPLSQSAQDERPLPELQAERAEYDARIQAWAAGLTQTWLDGELTWFSGAAGRELSRPMAILIPHFFNHQTHHRGQVHAMITAAGETTQETDLMLII